METAPKPLDHRLRSQLFRYGLGAAAAAAAAAPGTSDATVITFDPVDVTGNTIYFDLESNAVSNTMGTAGLTDFRLYLSGTATTKPSVGAYTGTTNSVLGSPGAFGFYAPRLGAGDTIGSGQMFGSGAFLDADPGNWGIGTRGFLGLTLTNGSGSFFGWAEITLNNFDGTGPGAFTLHGYAYENVAGQSITVPGVVPEGGSTALLLILGAAGMAGVRARRDRREQAN